VRKYLTYSEFASSNMQIISRDKQRWFTFVAFFGVVLLCCMAYYTQWPQKLGHFYFCNGFCWPILTLFTVTVGNGQRAYLEW